MPAISVTLSADFNENDTTIIFPPGLFNADPTQDLYVFKDTGSGGLIIEDIDGNSARLYYSDGFDLVDAAQDTGGYLYDFSDRTGSVDILGGNYADVITGGSGVNTLSGAAGNDVLTGGASNDVLEGGEDGDRLIGGAGIDTASYEHATDGVYVRLDMNVGLAGEAANDVLDGIENLIGSAYNDILAGDGNANKIVGNGGSDDITAYGGNDRIVISDSPQYVDGGMGTDTLIVTGGGMVSGSAFVDLETIYLRNNTSLNMSSALPGARIVSQSTADDSIIVIGTSEADRITAGKGSDAVSGGAGNDIIRGGAGHASLFGDAGNDRIVAGSGGANIEGGQGHDTLFGGAGSDLFAFSLDFGRVEIYNFQAGKDHFDIVNLGLSFADVNIKSVHGGNDTQVTFDTLEGSQKVILHDFAASSLTTNEFFGI